MGNYVACPEGEYITRLEGKAGESIDKFCAVCSGGKKICNGAGTGGANFSVTDKKGFSEITNYHWGTDDMTGFMVKANGEEFRKGSINKNLKSANFKCDLGKAISVFHIERGDINTGWAKQITGITCSDIPLEKTKLECDNSYITNFYGGAGNVIDRLCAKCANGTDLGCLGVSGGGNIYDFKSEEGFNGLDMGYATRMDESLLGNIIFNGTTNSNKFGGDSTDLHPFKCGSGQVIKSINAIKPVKAAYVPTLSAVCVNKDGSTGSGSSDNSGSSGSGSTGSGSSDNSGSSGSGSTGSGSSDNSGSSGSGSTGSGSSDNSGANDNKDDEDTSSYLWLYIIIFVVVIAIFYALMSGDDTPEMPRYQQQYIRVPNQMQPQFNQYQQQNQLNQYQQQNQLNQYQQQNQFNQYQQQNQFGNRY